MMFKSELDRFYNPTVESARTDSAEAKMKCLKGKSPVGEWIEGYYNGIQVSGFVLSIMGYGIMKVHWGKGSFAFSQEVTTVGLHGSKFYFCNKEMNLEKSDMEHLIDLSLEMNDFTWTRELFNRKKLILGG